jgi:flagellin-specific chaperone FliS
MSKPRETIEQIIKFLQAASESVEEGGRHECLEKLNEADDILGKLILDVITGKEGGRR